MSSYVVVVLGGTQNRLSANGADSSSRARDGRASRAHLEAPILCPIQVVRCFVATPYVELIEVVCRVAINGEVCRVWLPKRTACVAIRVHAGVRSPLDIPFRDLLLVFRLRVSESLLRPTSYVKPQSAIWAFPSLLEQLRIQTA